MTYEEAIKMQREMLKDSIKERLYKLDPIKYKRFKTSRTGRNTITPEEIMNIWDMVRTIDIHENGNLFERDDKFYSILKKKVKE